MTPWQRPSGEGEQEPSALLTYLEKKPKKTKNICWMWSVTLLVQDPEMNLCHLQMLVRMNKKAFYLTVFMANISSLRHYFFFIILTNNMKEVWMNAIIIMIIIMMYALSLTHTQERERGGGGRKLHSCNFKTPHASPPSAPTMVFSSSSLSQHNL